MKNNRILLIDDNLSDIELAKRAFNKTNTDYEVTVADSGKLGLDLLLGQDGEEPKVADLPVLILLDLKMPVIDGLDVLRKIREVQKTKHIPVVILTTSLEKRDIEAAYELGANSYIRKPVDFKQFSEAINSICLYWLKLNESLN